jgi:hypothetical protein
MQKMLVSRFVNVLNVVALKIMIHVHWCRQQKDTESCTVFLTFG